MSLIPEGFTEQEFNDLKNSDPEFAKVLIDELKQNERFIKKQFEEIQESKEYQAENISKDNSESKGEQEAEIISESESEYESEIESENISESQSEQESELENSQSEQKSESESENISNNQESESESEYDPSSENISESESQSEQESESESENGNISFEFSDFWKKKIARAIKKDIKNGFIFDDYIENKNEQNFDKVRSFCD